MARVYNFSAGPSMLPEAVLRRAQAEMLDYQGRMMAESSSSPSSAQNMLVFQLILYRL